MRIEAECQKNTNGTDIVPFTAIKFSYTNVLLDFYNNNGPSIVQGMKEAYFFEISKMH